MVTLSTHFNFFFRAVNTHFEGLLGAAHCDKPGLAFTEEIVGAKSDEVALLNGLTVNIHFLLSAFYKPSGQRRKILIEDHAFPSDRVIKKLSISRKNENLISRKFLPIFSMRFGLKYNFMAINLKT